MAKKNKADTAENTEVQATEAQGTEQAATTEAAAPAAKEEKTVVAKIQQNGVTRPKDGSTTGRVWAVADEISSKQQRPATRKEVIDQIHAEGINTSTGATQYGKWRKFHGLVGEQAPGRAAAPAAEAPAAS
jgi:hypothetical protein